MKAMPNEDKPTMAPRSTFLAELIPHIEKIVRNRGIPRSDQDDARQNVLLQLHRHAARLEAMAPDQRQRYASAVATGVAATLRRSHGEREHVDIDRIDIATRLLASSGSPDAILEQQHRIQTLMNGIRELAPRDRSVLELVEFDECSVVCAAGTLGIPVGTAATRLRRARAFLSKLFSREKRGAGNQRSRTTLRMRE